MPLAGLEPKDMGGQPETYHNSTEDIGLGRSEVERLKETGISMGSIGESVPARSVVETGSLNASVVSP